MTKLGLAAIALLSLTACQKPEPAPPAAKASADVAATSKPAAKAPSKKETARAAVGKPAPEFELTGLDGSKAKLSALRGKIVVLEWFNPDCPFVKNAHGGGSLKGLAKQVKEKHGDDVVWLAVNSGAEGRQGHGDETNRRGKERFGIDYPILYDADGTVGRAYQATNTPHMFVIDKEGVLVYAGALDNTGSGMPDDAEPKLINYVTDALDDVVAGKPVRKSSSRAWGCSVKYARN